MTASDGPNRAQPPGLFGGRLFSPPIARLFTPLFAPFIARERDVRDTLWILACAIWVILPHFVTLPIWASAATCVLLIWRIWITWSGRRLPARVWLAVLMLLAGGAVWMQFHTIFGKDAGVTYLVMLLALKLLEMRARRDIFVVIFLCLFVLLTSFFESQGIDRAVHMLVALVLLVTALVAAHFGTREPSGAIRLRIALQHCLYALPLMIVLFVLFPRIQGPLWGMPDDAFGVTGLSETMTPGSIANLSESGEIALRAEFTGRLPSRSELYWRGPVLTLFNGRTWRPGFQRFRERTLDIVPDNTSGVDYVVTLEPHNQPWLLTLDITPEAPSVRGIGSALRPDMQVVLANPARERLRYETRSYTRYEYGGNDFSDALREALILPPGFNPRTLQYARDMRTTLEGQRQGVPSQSATTPTTATATATQRFQQVAADPLNIHRTLIRQVLQTFRQENFVYTLQPPVLGRDSVDEFLFETRRGFCEHYAAAFVVLMRAMGIPARVVTGYQGGELNPINQFIEVRQRDAHAWAEVWLADSGWVRIDPTEAVAPERIERGATEALPEAQGIAAAFLGGTQLVRYMRFNWDAVTNYWNQWVLSFNPEAQRSIFSDIGIPDMDWRKLSIALILAFMVALAVVGVLVLLRRDKVDPVLALYLEFCERCARLGMPRMSHEGPQDYLERIAPRLPQRARQQAEKITRIYTSLRYAPPGARATGLYGQLKTCVHAFRG